LEKGRAYKHWKKIKVGNETSAVGMLYEEIRQEYLGRFAPFDDDPDQRMLTKAIENDMKEWLVYTTGNKRRARKNCADDQSNTETTDDNCEKETIKKVSTLGADKKEEHDDIEEPTSPHSEDEEEANADSMKLVGVDSNADDFSRINQFGSFLKKLQPHNRMPAKKNGSQRGKESKRKKRAGTDHSSSPSGKRNKSK
jgi:hypothetical protein